MQALDLLKVSQDLVSCQISKPDLMAGKAFTFEY